LPFFCGRRGIKAKGRTTDRIAAVKIRLTKKRVSFLLSVFNDEKVARKPDAEKLKN